MSPSSCHLGVHPIWAAISGGHVGGTPRRKATGGAGFEGTLDLSSTWFGAGRGAFSAGFEGREGAKAALSEGVGKAIMQAAVSFALMDRDLGYLDELIAAGQGFTYLRARVRDETDPSLEYSKEKWTEWMTKAEMAVQTFAKPQSKALELIREAKHLEVVGEIADEFYRSRELALSALRICARESQETPHSESEEQAHLEELLPEPSQERQKETALPGSLQEASMVVGLLRPPVHSVWGE